MARRDALIKLQKTLLTRRNELRKRLGAELNDLAQGEQSAATGDTADAAFEHQGEELASQLAELESKELAQIEHALLRLRQGKYGVCAGCETKIPVLRLNALPYSTLCITCQREAEQDETWFDSHPAANWEAVRDSGADDREVDISAVEMDLSK